MRYYVMKGDKKKHEILRDEGIIGFFDVKPHVQSLYNNL